MTEYVNLIAAALALLGASVGLRGFLRFRSRRETLARIGDAFTRLVSGLGSASHVERLASAALLPRFFDAKSEFGARGAPYGDDALKVAAAVLRSEPTGAVQKLLADGLAAGRSLDGADFQRANLRGTYWGRRHDGRAVSAAGADFFRADLSSSSLRGALLSGAVFTEAQLVGCALAEADLRGANFAGANLRGTNFTEARLAGARFSGARHVPTIIKEGLDADGTFVGDVVGQETAHLLSSSSERVFLSTPSQVDEVATVAIAQIRRGLADLDLELVTFPPEEYGTGAPLDEITRRIGACAAVVILGSPQLFVAEATWRPGTPASKDLRQVTWATPWNQIEAGIAAALDKPILIIRAGVAEGVFEIGDQPHAITVIDLSHAERLSGLDVAVRAWVKMTGICC